MPTGKNVVTKGQFMPTSENICKEPGVNLCPEVSML